MDHLTDAVMGESSLAHDDTVLRMRIIDVLQRARSVLARSALVDTSDGATAVAQKELQATITRLSYPEGELKLVEIAQMAESLNIFIEKHYQDEEALRIAAELDGMRIGLKIVAKS